ncbi:MAG: hypothetical protein AAB472_02410 [Patescibacteria group bacterium]
MTTSPEYLKQVKSLLTISLTALESSLLPQDAQELFHYIEHTEYGIAWETLWRIVKDNHLPVPPELLEVGKLIGHDTTQD